MSLLITMLPLYLFGNLHCLGMCGPLVFMLGQHRYRYFYFIGRILSFTLAGMVAGEIGFLINAFFLRYHISAAASAVFGVIMMGTGVCSLQGRYPGQHLFATSLAKISRKLSLLMLKDQPFFTFLFGFFTLALPCGQTIIVYSACALSGDFWVGMINGLAFALLTTPSLFLAMAAHKLFSRMKFYHGIVLGGAALLIGGLGFCRSLAEWGVISHLTFAFTLREGVHFVIY
jgi:sulfite exporter TauE/SafE